MSAVCDHYKALIITALSVAIVNFNVCDADTRISDDYDMPNINRDLDNYIVYHFAPCERYEQFKLDPYDYYMSYYNPHFQALPVLDSTFNYNLYKQQINIKKASIDLNTIENKYKAALEREKTKDDPRYAYPDPDHYWQTDEKYYESNIHKTHYDIAKEYYTKWYSLTEEQYNNVMVFYEVFKKSYENAQDFLEARLKLAIFIQDNTPGADAFKSNNLTSSGEMSEIISTRTHLRKESYEAYMLRSVSLNGMPFHQSVCKKLYFVTFNVDSVADFSKLVK